MQTGYGRQIEVIPKITMDVMLASFCLFVFLVNVTKVEASGKMELSLNIIIS